MVKSCIVLPLLYFRFRILHVDGSYSTSFSPFELAMFDLFAGMPFGSLDSGAFRYQCACSDTTRLPGTGLTSRAKRTSPSWVPRHSPLSMWPVSLCRYALAWLCPPPHGFKQMLSTSSTRSQTTSKRTSLYFHEGCVAVRLAGQLWDKKSPS